jgi:hypothetical protein
MGSVHTETICSFSEDILEMIPKLVAAYDEPFEIVQPYLHYYYQQPNNMLPWLCLVMEVTKVF